MQKDPRKPWSYSTKREHLTAKGNSIDILSVSACPGENEVESTDWRKPDGEHPENRHCCERFWLNGRQRDLLQTETWKLTNVEQSNNECSCSLAWDWWKSDVYWKRVHVCSELGWQEAAVFYQMFQLETSLVTRQAEILSHSL